MDVKSERLAVALDDRVELFDDIDRLILRREVLQELFGKRIDESELKIRRGVAESLKRVVERRSGGDDADLRAGILDDLVEGTVLGELAERIQTLFDLYVARTPRSTS